MRVYAYIPRLNIRINIQDIILKRDPKTGFPILYFDCYKKYEETIRGERIIFIDKHNKEYFRIEKAILDFRYYECDYVTQAQRRKVAFEARDVCLMEYGHISYDFMVRILSTVCNTKYKIEKPVVKPPEPPSRYPYKYPTEYMKYIWFDMKFSRWHPVFQKWYITCKTFAPLSHFILIYDVKHRHKYVSMGVEIISRAPT